MNCEDRSRADWRIDSAQSTGFDFDEVDRLLQAEIKGESVGRYEAEEESRCSADGEILFRTLEMLMPESIRVGSAQSIGIRALALAWMIQSSKGNVGSMSLTEIARKVQVTKAIFSYWVRHYEKALGFHARGQKSTQAVESYRKSSRRGWATRRQKKAAAAGGGLA